MLAVLGLDACAEEVYRVMLAHPGLGVAEIVMKVDRSEPEVREALEQLGEMGLVRPVPAMGEKMRATSPELGMKILLARQQAELASQQQKIEASRAAAAQLIAEYADFQQPDERSDVEQLTGDDRVRSRLTQLAQTAQREVLTFAHHGARTPESLRAARQVDEELLRRGVRLRTVYLDSVRNNARNLAYAKWLAEHGGHVRTAPSLPVRLTIVDGQVAVISSRTENPRQSAVVLRGQGTLTALGALFEGIWATATRLDTAHLPDGAGLSSQEREVLAQLYRGLTDDAIAKRLGVSPRTARRIANSLMERLQARSRFQAGALAVQHGWLPLHV